MMMAAGLAAPGLARPSDGKEWLSSTPTLCLVRGWAACEASGLFKKGKLFPQVCHATRHLLSKEQVVACS